MLLGWRPSTIDVDIRVEPDTDALFRAIPDIKESLQLNVELASPIDFIPVRPGWQECSPFIAQEGRARFHHFEPYAQALAKVERGHQQDLADVREMLSRRLVDAAGAWRNFADIEADLYRYPEAPGGETVVLDDAAEKHLADLSPDGPARTSVWPGGHSAAAGWV